MVLVVASLLSLVSPTRHNAANKAMSTTHIHSLGNVKFKPLGNRLIVDNVVIPCSDLDRTMCCDFVQLLDIATL